MITDESHQLEGYNRELSYPRFRANRSGNGSTDEEAIVIGSSEVIVSVVSYRKNQYKAEFQFRTVLCTL